MINKSRLKRAFNRSASTYDQYAKIQTVVGEELVSLVEGLPIIPNKILDIGSGTGTIALHIAKLFPGAEFYGCDIALGMAKRAEEKSRVARATNLHFMVADGEILPFKDHQFDLALSSLTYQWLDNMPGAFQEISRILRQRGYLVCSLLGKETMTELKSSYLDAQKKINDTRPSHFHEFAEEDSVLQVFEESGFINIRFSKTIKQEYHPDIKSIFSTLKAIGAQNVSREAPKGLGRRELFHWLNILYEDNFKTSSGLPLTYEIYYVTAEKG